MGRDIADAPVQRFRFASTAEDEVSDFIANTYLESRTSFDRVRRPADYCAHFVDAGSIASDQVQCSVGYSVSTEPWHFFCSIVMDRGTMQISSAVSDMPVGPGDVAMFPIAQATRIKIVDQSARMVRLPLTRLEQAGESLGLPAAQLRFDGMMPVSASMARYWRHLLGLVNGSLLDFDSPASSPLMREELTRMTALAALHVFPNTAMSQHHRPEAGRVAPAAVRRAVAHIDAHADEPLTLADIAAAAGVEARALQYAFRRHLDTTPMDHLRRVRLERAHRDLQAGDPTRGDTVAAIATRWGFGKPSRFAHDYRTAYGEPPSHTLRT
jgi:AraC-like DNA-binding protein